MRRVDKAKTEPKETITENAMLTELETLVTAARDAVEKAVQSLTAELTDEHLSRTDTTHQEQNTYMPMWCSLLSFQPIGNSKIRSVVNLKCHKIPVSKPTAPRTSEEPEQLEQLDN